ncbi:SMC-Scp complex subunit ScpB [Ligilactobacillus sp. LYQ60]|uniref:SMC-Scp complex subunit ScpB n=1 Tax=unclassified Ligilactobacillus TaxID=2767920 RepID=UPI003854509D
MATNQAKIEALLFVSGDDGITVTELAQLVGILKPAVLEQLARLEQKYSADRNGSLTLIHAEDRYRLVTKPGVATVVRRYFEAPAMATLSPAALETLAIIAYRQPITRVEIEGVRGVRASTMLQKLQAWGLIAVIGRLDAPGRPAQYGTTPAFLNYVGLTALTDLPPLPVEDDALNGESSNQYMTLFNAALTDEEDDQDA